MNKQAQKEEAKGNELLRAYVAKNMSLLGIKSKNELAARLHLSLKSLCTKLADPGKFRLWELRRLFYVLQFTEKEKNDVWGGAA